MRYKEKISATTLVEWLTHVKVLTFIQITVFLSIKHPAASHKTI